MGEFLEIINLIACFYNCTQSLHSCTIQNFDSDIVACLNVSSFWKVGQKLETDSFRKLFLTFDSTERSFSDCLFDNEVANFEMSSGGKSNCLFESTTWWHMSLASIWCVGDNNFWKRKNKENRGKETEWNVKEPPRMVLNVKRRRKKRMWGERERISRKYIYDVMVSRWVTQNYKMLP